jgi:hypothetical protein
VFDVEVGNIGRALGFDVAERAAEFAFGLESPGDAVKGAKVRVAVGEVAGDGRDAGIGRLPGAEIAAGVNDAGRL